MSPGGGPLTDGVTKNTKCKHEWLKGIALEHISTSFINVKDEWKKKLLLRVCYKLGVSFFIPLLSTNLYQFVIIRGSENIETVFGVHVDTKIIQVVEDKRSKEVANLGKYIEMWDLQVADLRDYRHRR
jgi:hypothetical protein